MPYITKEENWGHHQMYATDDPHEQKGAKEPASNEEILSPNLWVSVYLTTTCHGINGFGNTPYPGYRNDYYIFLFEEYVPMVYGQSSSISAEVLL